MGGKIWTQPFPHSFVIVSQASWNPKSYSINYAIHIQKSADFQLSIESAAKRYGQPSYLYKKNII